MILFMRSVRSYLLEREYLSDERAFVRTSTVNVSGEAMLSFCAIGRMNCWTH
jgi:hypothetical protein